MSLPITGANPHSLAFRRATQAFRYPCDAQFSPDDNDPRIERNRYDMDQIASSAHRADQSEVEWQGERAGEGSGRRDVDKSGC